MPDRQGPLFLGIDIGTYEAKGVVLDADGTLVAQARRAHQLSVPEPGRAEHDAELVWWDGLVTLARQLTDQLGPDTARLAAVGCSGIGPCVLPVDPDGRPLAPAILYGIDGRAQAEIVLLEERLGREEILRRAGNELSSQSAGPKIAWLARNHPGTAEVTARYHTCQSFLVERLTGRAVIDHDTASYFHPLYDLTAGVWDIRGCEDFLRSSQLPELAWATEIAGTVTAAAAEETGLPPGVPVIVGTSDAPAEAVASGVVEPGDAMVMYGSSSFLISVVDRPAPGGVLWSAPFVFPDSYCLAAGTSTAGTLTHWLAAVFDCRTADGGSDFAQLIDLAQQSPLGARGLLTLPHFSGERTPMHDPLARGVVAGLTLNHGRADLVRSALEGVAHSMVRALETFAVSGQPVTRVTAVGGGTANPVWLQAVSDISGREQHLVDTVGAAAGDAALAAVGTGHLAGPLACRTWVRPTGTTVPDPKPFEAYRRDHRRFAELYSATRFLWHPTEES